MTLNLRTDALTPAEGPIPEPLRGLIETLIPQYAKSEVR